MTEQQISARLARIESQLAHIDRSLAGPPTMAERVVSLEEWRKSLAALPRRLEEGQQHDAVADAVHDERERVRSELRKNIATIATIVGLVASVGSALGGVVGWRLLQMAAGG